MAARYVAGPAVSWYGEPVAQLNATTVYEAEPTSKPTGILNAQGVMIHKVEDRQPIGFDLRKK